MPNDISITCADVLDYLATVPDNSADLVIADPPYAIGYDAGKGWDSQWQTETDYLNWCTEWTTECARILKPQRMLIAWGTLKTDTFLRYKLDVLNHIPTLTSQNEIIWSYNWGGRTKKNFARKHEYAWCYSKGKTFLFNDDAIRVERKVKKDLRTGLPHTKGTIPTCVWEINNHTMSTDAVNWHPTTKNVAVLERMIRAYTNPGDLVLDPFLGSGSTAIAAIHTGRRAQGCELDPDYVNKARHRIHHTLTHMTDTP